MADPGAERFRVHDGLYTDDSNRYNPPTQIVKMRSSDSFLTVRSRDRMLDFDVFLLVAFRSMQINVKKRFPIHKISPVLWEKIWAWWNYRFFTSLCVIFRESRR